MRSFVVFLFQLNRAHVDGHLSCNPTAASIFSALPHGARHPVDCGQNHSLEGVFGFVQASWLVICGGAVVPEGNLVPGTLF